MHLSPVHLPTPKAAADLPQTYWGKILGMTPVALTILATLLAGLASGEMTKAQYDLSLAAQLQSKAGDQWAFFQAKRLRGSMQLSTLEILQATGEVHPVTTDALSGAVSLPANEADRSALGFVLRGEIPVGATPPAPDPKTSAALAALDQNTSQQETNRVLAALDERTLEADLRAARDRARAFDDAVHPIAKLSDQVDAELSAHRVEHVALARDFTALRLRFTALRYEAEARLNQAVAQLLEVQVKKSNLSADRHHDRSERFFYGMLAAQAGVIMATFALAARQRNFLWSAAAIAGLGAIAFALYVYLCV
jgi:Domain of unknown function (DUF4337)